MIVCGVDEAGRGPMFGPLVVAGVASRAHAVDALAWQIWALCASIILYRA